MKQFLGLFLVLLAINVSAQEFIEKQPTLENSFNPRLAQYRIDYPMGINGETFFNGAADYKISKKLHIQLENFYAKFGTHEQVRSSVLFKWYVKEKLYLFAGAETEYDIDQITGEPELLRVNLNLGVGYEVKPNFLLELGYHPEISSPKFDAFGRPLRKQNSFSFRARF